MFLQQQILNKLWESTSDSKEDDGTTANSTTKHTIMSISSSYLVYLNYLCHHKAVLGAGGLMIKHVASVHISSNCCCYKALDHHLTGQRIRIFRPIVHNPLYSYSIHSVMTQSHMLKKEKHTPVFTPSASFNYNTDRKDGKRTIVPESTNAVTEARLCTKSIME